MTDLREKVARIGAKVKFDSERCRYTVQAANDRFMILTKPFNAQKTYLYTIVDLHRGYRGACNLIFGLPCDVDTPQSAQEALEWIERGDMDVSYRNCVPLSDGELQAIRALSKDTQHD